MKHVTRFSHHVRHATQTGATLILGLIILTVMTVLGVAGMSTSQLELKMSNNALDKSRSFYASENTLLAAEKQAIAIGDMLRAGTGTFNCSVIGYYAKAGTVGANANCTGLALVTASTDPRTLAWDNTSSVLLSGTENRYVIEYLGSQKYVWPGDPNRGDTLLETQYTTYVFRITVRGIGRDGGATYLSTLYTRV